jgi:predicted SprT family Zn-dependent metalloprotease
VKRVFKSPKPEPAPNEKLPSWRCDHCRVRHNTVRVIWQATPKGRHNENYLCGSCWEKLSKWVTIVDSFPLNRD